MNTRRGAFQAREEAPCIAPEAGGRRNPRSVFRFLLFSLVGGAATAAHYAVLLVFVHVLAADPVRASALGAGCGALVSYVLNYHVTFCATAAHQRVLPRFFVMVTIGFALNFLLMLAFVDMLGLHYLLAQVVTTLLVLAVNYAISVQWVFAGGTTR